MIVADGAIEVLELGESQACLSGCWSRHWFVAMAGTRALPTPLTLPKSPGVGGEVECGFISTLGYTLMFCE